MKNILKFFDNNRKYFKLILPVILSIIFILIFLIFKIDVSIFLEYEL